MKQSERKLLKHAIEVLLGRITHYCYKPFCETCNAYDYAQKWTRKRS